MPYPHPTERNAAAQTPALTMCFAIMCDLLSGHALEVVDDWPASFVGHRDDHVRRVGGGPIDVLADVSGRALRETKRLDAAVREPDRHRLRAPIHVRDHALDGCGSVHSGAVGFVGGF